MEMFRSQRPDVRTSRGFSLLEVLIAVTVLGVGLSSLAALATQTLNSTEYSRYLGLSGTLASEKLEDLNRWSSSSSYVAAGGSLTSDTSAGGIDYFDDVSFSNTTGQVAETFSTVSGGTTTYTTYTHTANGQVNSSTSTTAPTVSTASGTVSFHRRWLIETNPTVNGVTITGSRRVTVLVTLTNGVVEPAVSFQMSAVRP